MGQWKNTCLYLLLKRIYLKLLVSPLPDPLIVLSSNNYCITHRHGGFVIFMQPNFKPFIPNNIKLYTNTTRNKLLSQYVY